MPPEMASMPASPVDRKAKISKRSSNSYSSEEWRRHRPLITRLYSDEGKTLKEVREQLERDFSFTPSERMYKSRLHAWGLDKKKKEHEMLDLVRQGLSQKGGDKDKAFVIRGRTVTLADALHYFNRKGIKDPTTLLDQPLDAIPDLSSPDDADIKTPLSTEADALDSMTRGDSDFEIGLTSPPRAMKNITSVPLQFKAAEFADRRLASLQAALNIQELKPMPAFRTLSVEAVVPPASTNADECKYMEAVFAQLQAHYRHIFTSRNMSVNNSSWTATSDDADADRFYYAMYQGYGFLWNGQREDAFKHFFDASELIEPLIKDNHVAFLIYVFDLVIRHDGTGYEEPLLMILQHVADMARTVYNSDTQPIYLIALWLKNSNNSRSWIAECSLRKLLDFFQDSIGYFHSETIALLQTFATALLNRQRYREAAVRFQQLVDAFETTLGKQCYEACYALRSTSEAYFHMGQFPDALQALKAALERSHGLDREEEREIYVRCLRGMAEISNKLGRHDEAVETMQHVVDATREAFGPDHTFTKRASMHLKSVKKGEALDSTIPPMVYRLGRGGNSAKYVWTTRSSPTRLDP